MLEMMVIELSGVQFGLKLKIERAGSEFDLKSTSMISDQNCLTQSSIATLLDPF